MAIAVRDLERSLVQAKDSVRVISRAARGVDRAALLAALLCLGVALLAVKLAAHGRERGQLQDPVLKLHSEAVEDDEPVTAEDQAAIDTGLPELRRGRGPPPSPGPIPCLASPQAR